MSSHTNEASDRIGGRVVFYGNFDAINSHSAYISSHGLVSPVTSIAVADIVVSKWGSNGLFKHPVGVVPDIYAKTLRYYKLA